MQYLSALLAEIQATLPGVKDRRAGICRERERCQHELDCLLKPLRMVLEMESMREIEAQDDGAGGMLISQKDQGIAAVIAGSDQAEKDGDFVACMFSEVPEQFDGEIEPGEVIRLLRNEYGYFADQGICREATDSEIDAAQPSPLRRRLALLALAERAAD